MDSFLSFFLVVRDILTVWPEFDKIHQRLSVMCWMLNEAHHRDRVLHGLNTQCCEWAIWLVFTYELGLSCGKGQMSAKSLSFSFLPGCSQRLKKNVFVLYKGILNMYHIWLNVRSKMKRCSTITNNSRAIIQLPDDLWRWVVGLSCAFQVKSFFMSYSHYFGWTLN